MKTISIRELHERTGEWVRKANHHGEIMVTDRGQVVAKIVPEGSKSELPFFARPRKLSRAFARLQASGKLKGGVDSTIAISEDREDRYS
jgi:antitoxin (DNA-binding transcriptional repressor) of toxin-antitoxin stability system